jgi:3-deoxy-D-manno-octulosonate 8-phosphate phosphatase (KDO 8-P phosphatase)
MSPEELNARATRIKLLVLDVDGVLTDGALYLGSDGTEYKRFNVQDGHGLVMLRDAGLQLAVISGRSSAAVAGRMAELGVKHVYQGCTDKARVLAELLDELCLEPRQAAFIGDDLPDLGVIEVVGLGVAVANAIPALAARAHYVTERAGGCGAVRELAELILDAQGLLNGQIERYRGRAV